jgi:hypothetical protein
MALGAIFPPVVVFHDGTDHWLADGFHRWYGHDMAEIPDILADVREGGQRDAILYSVSANAEHGWRRSNEDKRRAVDALLEDSEWAAWSDREIARRCGVHNETVAARRRVTDGNRQLDPQRPDPTPRIYRDKHGNTSTMNTAGIGRGREVDPDREYTIRDDPRQIDIEETLGGPKRATRVPGHPGRGPTCSDLPCVKTRHTRCDAAIKAKKAEGKTVRQVADETGVGLATVDRVLKDKPKKKRGKAAGRVPQRHSVKSEHGIEADPTDPRQTDIEGVEPGLARRLRHPYVVACRAWRSGSHRVALLVAGDVNRPLGVRWPGSQPASQQRIESVNRLLGAARDTRPPSRRRPTAPR